VDGLVEGDATAFPRPGAAPVVGIVVGLVAGAGELDIEARNAAKIPGSEEVLEPSRKGRKTVLENAGGHQIRSGFGGSLEAGQIGGCAGEGFFAQHMFARRQGGYGKVGVFWMWCANAGQLYQGVRQGLGGIVTGEGRGNPCESAWIAIHGPADGRLRIQGEGGGMDGADDTASEDGNVDHSCYTSDGQQRELDRDEHKNAESDHRAMAMPKLAAVVLAAEVSLVKNEIHEHPTSLRMGQGIRPTISVPACIDQCACLYSGFISRLMEPASLEPPILQAFRP
jgi:hypothetical protein